MNRIMAVYDVDPFYADRFAEFVNRKEAAAFTAVAFTRISRLKEFMETRRVELLLVGDEIKEEELKDLGDIQIIRLSETGVVQDEHPTVYKYQASDNVLREVMACYQIKERPQLRVLEGRKCRVMGVYSPVSRCGKTGFALTLGQVLARESKTLFLSLENFSGLSTLTGTSYRTCLADLLYHIHQNETRQLCMGSVVYSWGSLDYVPPVIYGEDLSEIKGSEIAILIEQIVREGGYEVLILDMGHFSREVEVVLALCDTIYAPVTEDIVSMAKLQEWKEYLTASGREALWEKVQILHLPVEQRLGTGEAYLEQLLWSPLGDYVRALILGKADSHER